MSLCAKLQLPILRDALGIGAVKAFAIPVTLLVAIILARKLGPENYGIYAFVLSLINVFALFLSGGVAQLVTREVAVALHENQPSLIKGIIRSAITWGFLSSVLIVVGMALTLVLFSDIINGTLRTVLMTGFLALPILCLSPVWSGTLRGYGLAAKSQFPGLLLMPMTQLALILLFFWLGGLNPQTAMLAFLFANIIVAVVGLHLMRETVYGTLGGANAEYNLGPWAKSSVVFTSIALITFLNTQVGVLLLGFTSTTADVGAFQIADRGAQLTILTTGIIELVLAPHVARHHKAGQLAVLKHLFRMSRRIGAAMTLIIALPLILQGTPIVRLLFGENYVEKAVEPLAIISLALAVRASLGPTSTFLAMTGNERSMFAVQGLALLVNVVLTLVLAPSLGATGAAWAAAAGIVIWSGLLAIQTHRRLGIAVLWL